MPAAGLHMWFKNAVAAAAAAHELRLTAEQVSGHWLQPCRTSLARAFCLLLPAQMQLQIMQMQISKQLRFAGSRNVHRY